MNEQTIFRVELLRDTPNRKARRVVVMWDGIDFVARLSERVKGKWVENKNASYFTDDLADAVGTAQAMFAR